jgi:disulfide oxidoreductase YuzD
MKYYSDKEIVELVENIGDSKESYQWVASLVRERFEQKDNQREYIARRCNIAAEHMGHTLISELMEEGF